MRYDEWLAMKITLCAVEHSSTIRFSPLDKCAAVSGITIHGKMGQLPHDAKPQNAP
jgi:hypothetical protein